MNNILTMLRHEFRGRFNIGKNSSPKSWGVFILNLIISLLMYAVYFFGVYFIAKILLTGTANMGYVYLVFATAISIIIQIFTVTGALVKNLYYNGDNELLLRFPVDGLEIFLSKSAYVFIKNAVVSLLITLPFYIMFAVIMGRGVGFYIHIFFMSIYISIVPYCIANFIAIPVMHLVNTIKNKFGLILGFLILMIVVGFSMYMLILKGILEYYQTQATTMFSQEILDLFKTWANTLFPSNLFANILIGRNIFLSILFSGLLSIGLAVLSYFLAKISYYPTILKSLEREKTAFTKKTKDKTRTVFGALLRNEYLQIFRSFNYSFQYLAMAIAAPVMVYFCNDLACSIGDASVGSKIVPGLSLMVIIIFITIIVSFASTTISRNGNTFYFTKLMPVHYKYQIFVKMVLYMIVSVSSVIVSLIVIGIAFGGAKYGNNVRFVDLMSIFGITLFVIIFLISAAIKSDLKSPTFEVNNNGELVEANKNVSNSLIGGCLIAVLYGLFAMIFTYIPLSVGTVTLINGIGSVYLYLFGISFVMAGISCLNLFLKIDKFYKKIIP